MTPLNIVVKIVSGANAKTIPIDDIEKTNNKTRPAFLILS